MKRLTRGKSIQIFCHECFGWDARRRPDGKSLISYLSAGYEVSKCESEICPLWSFRNGLEEKETNPNKNIPRETSTLTQSAFKNGQKGRKVSQDGVN